MSEAKIRLSSTEMEMVTNAQLILTKNAILQKVNDLLAAIAFKQQEYLQSIKDRLPDLVFKAGPKISKGEQYKGLPYQVLDHPRYFAEGNFLAIRTMFWWGHFFSVTLHVSGENKKACEPKIMAQYESLKEDCYLGINEDPWRYDFEPDNFQPLKGMKPDLLNKIKLSPFVKLAFIHSLGEWETVEEKLLEDFRKLVRLIMH